MSNMQKPSSLPTKLKGMNNLQFRNKQYTKSSKIMSFCDPNILLWSVGLNVVDVAGMKRAHHRDVTSTLDLFLSPSSSTPFPSSVLIGDLP